MFLIGVKNLTCDFNIDLYDKNIPFGEIEILDATVLKKKWFGFYNKKNKEYERDWASEWNVCDTIDCM